MRAVVTRVTEASVTIENEVVGKIEKGFLILLGITHEDTEEHCRKLAEKVLGLRVFTDENGKMNLSLKTVNGKILSISQFTLYADTKDGNRPAFINAMKPQEASKLYDMFNEELRGYDIDVLTGVFGADMKINLINDGPVTIIYDENL